MMEVHYFARFREALSCEQEQLELASDNNTIALLMAQLAKRGQPWSDIFNDKQRVLVAINQEMVRHDATIADGDEVGFFPPVTGG